MKDIRPKVKGKEAVQRDTLKKYTCFMCDKELPRPNFYSSYNPMMKTGLIPYCKDCLRSNCLNENGNFILEKFKAILKIIDKPFFENLWETTVTSVKEKGSLEFFGTYMKNVQMPQHKYKSWGENWTEEKIVATVLKKDKEPRVDDFVLTDEIADRWGYGYEFDEYKAFEKKYQFLKNNYREKTAMHTENLLNYIRYRVKEEIATAKGDTKEAKEWGNLAKDAAKDAKLNVAQLSASDLSDGVNTFSQIGRAVEECYDVTEILPLYKARPQDDADFILWRLVDYVRDLKGLPPCEYSELYTFLDVLKKEHQERDKLGETIDE